MDLKTREIARQAPIFGNAQIAIAWLHDVQDLSCIEGLFRVLAVSLPQLELSSEQQKTRDHLLTQASEKIVGPTGLFNSEISNGRRRYEDSWTAKSTVQAFSGTEYPEVNHWFTSLWTLQEACLRPDMWLATSNWSFFPLGQRNPTQRLPERAQGRFSSRLPYFSSG